MFDVFNILVVNSRFELFKQQNSRYIIFRFYFKVSQVNLNICKIGVSAHVLTSYIMQNCLLVKDYQKICAVDLLLPAWM
jgi:hypothetical protein